MCMCVCVRVHMRVCECSLEKSQCVQLPGDALEDARPVAVFVIWCVDARTRCGCAPALWAHCTATCGWGCACKGCSCTWCLMNVHARAAVACAAMWQCMQGLQLHVLLTEAGGTRLI